MKKVEKINKRVDMIVWFRANETPVPLKFQVNEGNERETIKVDNIISVEKQQKGGEDAYIFDCQSVVDERVRRYTLKYIISDCSWYLCTL